MKHIHRIVAITVLLGMVIGGAALALTLGDEIRTTGVEIAEGVELAKGVYWNSQYSDRVAENYIEYTPGGHIKPVVAYGSKVNSYGSFGGMAEALNRRGQYVIGGINGDYYELANYIPLGILIADGQLKSAEGTHQAVGFREDGTAFIGAPNLTMSVTIDGERFPVAVINKIRFDWGFAIFTDDFAPTTKNKIPGKDIIMSVVEGELRVNSEVRFVVDEIVESEGEMSLPEGKIVLSLSEEADEWRQNGIEGLQEGDEIVLSVKSADPIWDEAVYALGSFCRLIEDGEIVSEGLVNAQGPRSAVGIRADGSILLYTVDGRQAGLSAGIGTRQLAERLLELGCVDAGMMDGGGSTSLNSIYIGQNSLAQINSPSGGSQRSVTNYIMLVTEEEPDWIPARLGLFPFDVMMLAGAKQNFIVKAADRTGRPTAVPDELMFSSSLGEYDDGVYTAGTESGTDSLTVTDGEIHGAAVITVVRTPDAIAVYRKGSTRRVDRLDLLWSESVSLTAASAYRSLMLVSDESCYIWSASEKIGTVDERGEFTAVAADAEGTISITAGEKMITIPVTVNWLNPFTDVSKSDWFYKSVQFAYEAGLFSGVEDKTFAPRLEMTRGMFVTVLGRLTGTNTNDMNTGLFSDVGVDEFFTEYVAWAHSAGLVNGFEDGTFRPNEGITREQLCVLLARYAAYAGVELAEIAESLENAEPSEFEDSSDISVWAWNAVELCQRAKLIQGVGDGRFDPSGTAARADVAAILMRFSAITEPPEDIKPLEDTEASEATEPLEDTEPSETTEPSEDAEPSETTEPPEGTESSETTEPDEVREPGSDDTGA